MRGFCYNGALDRSGNRIITVELVRKKGVGFVGYASSDTSFFELYRKETRMTGKAVK